MHPWTLECSRWDHPAAQATAPCRQGQTPPHFSGAPARNNKCFFKRVADQCEAPAPNLSARRGKADLDVYTYLHRKPKDVRYRGPARSQMHSARKRAHLSVPCFLSTILFWVGFGHFRTLENVPQSTNSAQYSRVAMVVGIHFHLPREQRDGLELLARACGFLQYWSSSDVLFRTAATTVFHTDIKRSSKVWETGRYGDRDSCYSNVTLIPLLEEWWVPGISLSQSRV